MTRWSYFDGSEMEPAVCPVCGENPLSAPGHSTLEMTTWAEPERSFIAMECPRAPRQAVPGQTDLFDGVEKT